MADISKDFLEDPAGLYARAGDLTAEQRGQLMALEEALVAAGYAHGLRSATLTDENSVALRIDSGQAATSAELEVVAAIKAMDSEQREQLPSVLRSVVQRTLSGPSQAKSPALVLRLGASGLKVLRSAIQGLTVLPAEFVPTRSAKAAAPPRVDMRQQTEHGLSLEYQVIQEGVGELMLVVRFHDRPAGAFRVDLLEDERAIDSQMLGTTADHATFSRITAGAYEIEISGPVTHRFGLFVEGEN